MDAELSEAAIQIYHVGRNAGETLAGWPHAIQFCKDYITLSERPSNNGMTMMKTFKTIAFAGRFGLRGLPLRKGYVPN